MIYGIDVSNYQDAHFPLELPDGTPIDFVIIQVTRGMDGVNEKWRGQADWARENGLAVGFYHFGKAADSPDAQARRFNAELTKYSFDVLYPGETLWYDWEGSVTAPAPTNTQKDQFIQELKRLRPGRKVGLYCNVDYWKNRDTTDYCGDALWIASWSDPVKEPNIEHAWTIHQYSDGGGKLDHNRANFDHREDMKIWGGKPPSDVELLARGLVELTEVVREIRGLVREIRPYLGDMAGKAADQERLATSRFDALKGVLDVLAVDVASLEPVPTPTVGQMVESMIDELRRRLES